MSSFKLILLLSFVHLITNDLEMNESDLDQLLTLLMPYGVLDTKSCADEYVANFEEFCLNRRVVQKSLHRYAVKQFKWKGRVNGAAEALMKQDQFTDCKLNVVAISQVGTGVSIGSGLLNTHYTCSGDYLSAKIVSQMKTITNKFMAVLLDVAKGDMKVTLAKFICYTREWLRVIIDKAKLTEDKLPHVESELQLTFDKAFDVIDPGVRDDECKLEDMDDSDVKHKYRSIQLNWLIALNQIQGV